MAQELPSPSGWCRLTVDPMVDEHGTLQGAVAVLTDISEQKQLEAERERSQLIDHIGACERILKTPLARVFSIKIRRFLFLYLAILPVAIVDRCGALTVLLTMLVAYPLLSLDQIGIELENPFSKARLSHLPLEEIGATIQRNVQRLDDPGTVPLIDAYRGPARLNGHSSHPQSQPRAVG